MTSTPPDAHAEPAGRRRVGVVSGYFNPLHVGHVRMIVDARSLADTLVVIVNNDTQQLAKIGRLVLPLADRMEVVRALRDVDEVVASVDEDATVNASLRAIRARYPDAEIVFANGGDRSDPESVAEIATCRELDIVVTLGVGGRDKAEASSRINEELRALADETGGRG